VKTLCCYKGCLARSKKNFRD